MSRGSIALVLVVVLFGGSAESGSPAAAPDTLNPAQTQLLTSYFTDPVRNRGALLAAARGGVSGLPTPMILAVADAHMRGARFLAARDAFATVLAQTPGEPLLGWTRIGYAWASIGAKNDGEARRQLVAASAGDGPAAPLAQVVLALVDGARERYPDAEAGFEHVVDGGGSPDIVAAARLGVGLARYWRGDYAGARVAFTELSNTPANLLADDARYGAARAALANGDPDARDMLRALAAGSTRARRAHFSGGMVDLAPTAILSSAFQRYRRSPSRLPEAQVAAALDSDGGELARAALIRLERATEAAAPRPHAVEARLTRDGRDARQLPPGVVPERQDTRSARSRWLVLAVVAIVLGAVVVARRWPGRSKTPRA